ncbi:MAG: hypothetical protein OXF05_06835 [Hyphomicrobiales bacterium]|nr:hypothetical protein [Hyphomicrobiales bacterium]MCY4033675.1 hypothetical protein [Hyphomicrobiales bacterium]MCY4038478.1 hypothetical protein [Hyphomicrobiales bacterium]
MIRGRVRGRVWSSKHVETVPNGALLDVEIEDGSHVVAFDPLGCGEGEAVLVSTGSVAASFFDKAKPPIDALIIASIDEAKAPATASKRRASGGKK